MITIRLATASDSKNLFDWRNDERTRAVSGSQEEVAWVEHEAWFARALADSDRSIYLAESVFDDGIVDVGMCRFDYDPSTGRSEVSINLNPAVRGRGLAATVLASAIERYRAEHRAAGIITATIRSVNVASIRLFAGAGFVRVSADSDFERYELA